jgi:hypothetical protein
MSGFAAKVMHEDAGQLVYLVTGQRNALPVWCYALVPERSRVFFQQAIQQGRVNITQFGQILFSGKGKNPPKEIEEIISVNYKLIIG